jgi:hypothetical protein
MMNCIKEDFMFPWFWIYAPQTHWPWSGAVTQDISPETFFAGIKPGAGVPEIERAVFEKASYGKQLGWLLDAVAGSEEEKVEALANLRELHEEVRQIKRRHAADRERAAMKLLSRLEEESPEALQRVLQRFAAASGRRAALPTP